MKPDWDYHWVSDRDNKPSLKKGPRQGFDKWGHKVWVPEHLERGLRACLRQLQRDNRRIQLRTATKPLFPSYNTLILLAIEDLLLGPPPRKRKKRKRS